MSASSKPALTTKGSAGTTGSVPAAQTRRLEGPDLLAARLAAAPSRYKPLYQRALVGALPPRQAIKVKCLDCVAFHRFEGGDDQIANCPVRTCPLWPLRPFQTKHQGGVGAAEVPERTTSVTEGGPDKPKADQP